MRILITGIAGFIGSHLAIALQRQGHEVHGVDNLETGSESNWHFMVDLDIADRQKFYRVANAVQPELVIHCAASYKDPIKWHRDVDTNITGTINATLVAKHHDCPIVYFQTALPSVSSYAISKIAGQQYIELSGVPYLIFRLANIYGPRNLSGPIPTFYKRIKAGQPCTVVDTSRDMVYIDGLVECVMLALESEARGVYDVCSGEQTPIARLYGEVAELFGQELDAPIVPPSKDDVQTQVSLERTLPGWKATTEIGYGIGRAVDWYEQHGVGETFTHLKVGA